ncbi:MAG: hypothetical protein IJH77_00795 [Mogibacterium sp.]|nr:hypothetical protein [Mogibacterium sp.]
MKKRWILITIYLLLVLGCALLIYVVPSVAGLFEGTYIAEYGQIEVSDDGITGWISRDEKVYTAAAEGEINRLAPENSLVKAGARVVELTGEGRGHIRSEYKDSLEELGDEAEATSGITTKPGYAVYRLDGCEVILAPARLETIKEEECKSIGNDGEVALPEKECAEGEPIFKIITNGNWYVVCWMDSETAARYSVGDSVSLVIDGQSLAANVRSMEDDGKRTRIVFLSRAYCETYLTSRKVTMKVVKSSADGLILQHESLVEIDGQTGVIVKNKIGKYYFRPVRIKADNGVQVAVYEDLYMDDKNEFVETVSTYDEILRAPTEKELEEIIAERQAEKEAAEKEAAEEAAREEAEKKVTEKQEAAQAAREASGKGSEEAGPAETGAPQTENGSTETAPETTPDN